jgi:hypothetical protein
MPACMAFSSIFFRSVLRLMVCGLSPEDREQTACQKGGRTEISAVCGEPIPWRSIKASQDESMLRPTSHFDYERRRERINAGDVHPPLPTKLFRSLAVT